jgi:hypothetical protein
MRRKHFRLKRIALGLAFAAVAVPTAQAKPVEWSPPAHHPIASEISVQSGVTPLQADGLRWTAMAKAYERMAAAHKPIASEISVQSPGVQLTAETQRQLAMAKATDSVPGTVAGTTPGNAVVKASDSGGFNWSDAGIGASVSFGLALVLLTAVGLGRRYRSRSLAI